jgi:hypothetical protein
MKTLFKIIVVLILCFIILGSCSIISFIGGYSIKQIDDIGLDNLNNQLADTDNTQIVESPVYYEKLTEERYIDEDSSNEIYQKLIQDSSKHFTFEINALGKDQFQDDQDFILANLENQYLRLSVKFNTQVATKIRVLLIDNSDMYETDLGIDYENTVIPFAAFASGTDLIEIFINPTFTLDKFELARTLSHELVHIFQHQNNSLTYYYIPDWYIEGMAEEFSYPKEYPLIHKDIYREIPDIEELNSLISSPSQEDYMIAYDTAFLYTQYLNINYGEEKLIKLLKCNSVFEQCFTNTLGVSINKSFQSWLNTL